MSADETDRSARRLESTPQVNSFPGHATRNVIGSAVFVSVTASMIAAVIGLRMAFHATLINCPDGTYFPEGTKDFRCFAHKHAGEGTVVLLFAVAFIVLVSLAAYIALRLSERQI